MILNLIANVIGIGIVILIELVIGIGIAILIMLVIVIGIVIAIKNSKLLSLVLNDERRILVGNDKSISSSVKWTCKVPNEHALSYNAHQGCPFIILSII